MWFDILLWIVLFLCYFVIEGESEECVLGGGLYSFKKIGYFGQKFTFVGEMCQFSCIFGIIIVPLQPKFVGQWSIEVLIKREKACNDARVRGTFLRRDVLG